MTVVIMTAAGTVRAMIVAVMLFVIMVLMMMIVFFVIMVLMMIVFFVIVMLMTVMVMLFFLVIMRHDLRHQLSLQILGPLDGGKNILTIQLLPWRGDNHGLLIVLPDQGDACVKLLL